MAVPIFEAITLIRINYNYILPFLINFSSRPTVTCMSSPATPACLHSERTQSEIDHYLAFDIFSEPLSIPQSFARIHVTGRGSLEREEQSLEDEGSAEDEVDKLLTSLLNVHVAPLSSRLNEQEVDNLLTSDVFHIPVNPLPLRPSVLEAHTNLEEERINNFLASDVFHMAINPLTEEPLSSSCTKSSGKRKRSGGPTGQTVVPEPGDNHREQEQYQPADGEGEGDNAEVPGAIWTPAGNRLLGL